MSILQLESHRLDVVEKFDALVSATSIPYRDLKPSMIPEQPGVYLITAMIDAEEQVYYVGRTKNLRRRLSSDHLHGNLAGARLKKYLIASEECADKIEAKKFIRQFCSARWIEHADFRMRGAIEGYATALLFPKHGIYREH
jgi:predicted GIY-YIG superfamily endonuclease